MSTNSVVYSPINYKLELKRLVVNEFRNYFDALSKESTIDFQRATLANVHTIIEYPLTAEGYPALIVGYRERATHNAGISHVEEDSNLTLERWIFEGDLVLEIFALTSLERDYLSDNVVNLLAFGNFLGAVFEQNVDTATSLYDVQANMKYLEPMAEEVMSGAAWGITDTRIYTCGYSFPIIGSFNSHSIYEQYITGINANISDGIHTNIHLNLPK